MKKFSDLKKWLTVPEAAKRLTNYFGEGISEADVLQGALDGHFTISINIITPVKARSTKIVEWRETEWLMLPSIRKILLPPELTFGNAECPPMLQKLWEKIPEDERKNCFPVLCDRQIDDTHYLSVGHPITEISGIFDLPMIGDERLDIEHQYHLLTCGPVVGLQRMAPIFVEDENGVIWQLQDDEKIFGAPPTEVSIHLQKLKEQICSQKIRRPAIKKLLVEHEHRYLAEYLQEADRDGNKTFRCKEEAIQYGPADFFPEQSVVVLRSSVLHKFEQSMGEGFSVKEDFPTADQSPKIKGHLNLDPDLQLQANKIAADLKAKSVIKKAPTKKQVAKILGKTLGMDPGTVERRIRKEW